MHVRSGQKRKRAEDQAAAAVGIKKPNTTPPPEGSEAPVSSTSQSGEPMEHDGQPLRPSKRASQSDLRVESLGGPPQVLLVVAAYFHMRSACTVMLSESTECVDECEYLDKTVVNSTLLTWTIIASHVSAWPLFWCLLQGGLLSRHSDLKKTCLTLL